MGRLRQLGWLVAGCVGVLAVSGAPARQDRLEETDAGLALPELIEIAHGRPFPELGGVPVGGAKPLLMADLKGKVVVVAVWASWCGSCRSQKSFIRAMHTAYAGKGVEFVGISMDGDRKALESYFKSRGPDPWPTLMAVDAPLSDRVAQFGVTSLPYYYVISREGLLQNSGLAGDELWRAVGVAAGATDIAPPETLNDMMRKFTRGDGGEDRSILMERIVAEAAADQDAAVELAGQMLKAHQVARYDKQTLALMLTMIEPSINDAADGKILEVGYLIAKAAGELDVAAKLRERTLERLKQTRENITDAERARGVTRAQYDAMVLDLEIRLAMDEAAAGMFDRATRRLDAAQETLDAMPELVGHSTYVRVLKGTREMVNAARARDAAARAGS